MFYFVCRTLRRCRNGFAVTAQNPSMAVPLSLRFFCSDANSHSFTVNYLTSKYGLSPESALLASKKVRLKNSHDSDLILSFFEKRGFLKTEISEMVMKYPRFLEFNPEKIVFPKVEFFSTEFDSTIDLVRIFTSYPLLLAYSLNKQLIPSFNLLKDLLQSKEKAVAAVKRNPGVLALSFKKRLIPRASVFQFLSSNGLIKLDSRITTLFLCKEEHFQELVMNYGDEAPHLLKLYNDKLKTFDKCGSSPESASENAQRKTSEKPNLALSFLKKIGVSKTQITKMIRMCPGILSRDEEKTIFPKVKFLFSKGMSTRDLVKMFTSYPYILNKSLKNHWVPSFNFFKELLQSEEKAIAAVRRHPRFLCCFPEVDMMCNINTLRENGVSVENIIVLVGCNHQCINMNSDKFGKIVEEVREMGINTSEFRFVGAVIALALQTKYWSWDQKVSAYKRWGWSDENVTAAFKRYPWCMSISEDKLMSVMDFYVNQIGLDSSVIANCPVLLGYSLKKRLIPRAAVIQFLSSKGLLKLDSSLTSVFRSSEKRFFEKFVNCHKEAPLLLKLFNEKLDSLA